MGQSIEGKCIKQLVANYKNNLKSLQLKGTHTQHITISDVRDKKKVKPHMTTQGRGNVAEGR